MYKVSENIELEFYRVLEGMTSLQEFEEWIYTTTRLESELTETVYIDLISINFKDKYALNEIEKVIGRYVNYGKFEIKKIRNVLESIIKKDESCVDSIIKTYELYCSGYDFLRKLGLTYGLLLACPPAGDYMKSWEELTQSEQKEILSKTYPHIIEDAKMVLAYINDGKIIVKNSVDELGNFEYDDFRDNGEIY